MPNLDTNHNDSVSTPRAPEHLNSSGCHIKYSEGKGRGIYASKSTPIGTVVEISPVLLFTKEEYDEHGRHTVLDHYTFKWRDGRMALALGLGSLFNHSETPNISYTLDSSTESIRYTTTKTIQPGEEMCIFYGHNLWFTPVGSSQQLRVLGEETDDEWRISAGVMNDVEAGQPEYPACLDGDPGEIIPIEDLPFVPVKVARDEDEEEELSAVRTVNAWVVDIPNPRDITTMLKWLKQSGLDSPELGHLKRIRNKEGVSSLLLCGLSFAPPPFPENLNLRDPYTLAVPRTAGLTMNSVQLKSSLWPTIYSPRRRGEIEAWPRGKVRWAWESMKVVVEAGSKAKAQGELPIAAYVPAPFEETGTSFVAHDTRHSTAHPLRHAVLNVTRCIADYRASMPIIENVEVAGMPAISRSTQDQEPRADGPQNGNHYLLTSLALFTTHEPCIMCSMALLHSRVKEVFYLVPMEKTGGCGGSACLPKLEGVNHRFSINRWTQEGHSAFDLADIAIDEVVDG